jgi:hypothetical protein
MRRFLLPVCLAACSEYGLDPTHKAEQPDAVDIEVTPENLDFGTVPKDCIVESTLTVTNVGEGLLTVDASWYDGDGDEVFSSEDLDRDLLAGESATFRARFSPTDDGEYAADLLIASNDPDEPELAVPSVGVAGDDTLVQDAWLQPAPEVDVLWVIDNSSSMSAEQARVASAISSFFASFIALEVDYHMGVIATDVVNPLYSGSLVGTPSYIDATTADPETELAEALQVGTDDLGDESGLLASELALSEPLISTTNAGFLREDATLAVVYFSDEPEQSTYDAQHYIDFLATVKEDTSKLSISAIVGDEGVGCTATCSDGDASAEAGDKYIAVQQAYDGVFGSICSCDLTATLVAVGEDATQLVRTYALSQVPPDPSSIRVYVDAIEITGWTYDADTNSIVLDDAPEEGSVIAATYEVASECPSAG